MSGTLHNADRSLAAGDGRCIAACARCLSLRDLVCWLLCFGSAVGAASAAERVGQPDGDGRRLFAVGIEPLLVARCLPCHGQDPELTLGGLDLTTRDGLLRGGQSGIPAVVPGDAEASLLLDAVSGERADLAMPPKENDRLASEDVSRLRRWIRLGAPWPSESEIAAIRSESAASEGEDGRIRVATSGGQTEAWTQRLYEPADVWAFRPVRKPAVPAVQAPSAVDAFHRSKLAGAGIEPAGPASKRVLLRRVFFGLTGLPPTPEQAAEYLEDTAPGAWERLVDRLLASRAYGEQWGRHWLDVVRYADTAGNSNDYERSNAWRYRDYVVRAFNADKPYDRFVIEQLAGDELRPDDPEMRVATGFLRMGPWGSAMVPKRMAGKRIWTTWFIAWARPSCPCRYAARSATTTRSIRFPRATTTESTRRLPRPRWQSGRRRSCPRRTSPDSRPVGSMSASCANSPPSASGRWKRRLSPQLGIGTASAGLRSFRRGSATSFPTR